MLSLDGLEALRRWRVSIFLELTLWLVVPGFFLYTYIADFGADVAVVFPHLLLVYALWVAAFSLRMLNWRYGNGWVQRVVGVFLFFAPFLILLAWYVLVITR